MLSKPASNFFYNIITEGDMGETKESLLNAMWGVITIIKKIITFIPSSLLPYNLLNSRFIIPSCI